MDFRIIPTKQAAITAVELVDQVSALLRSIDRETLKYQRILEHQRAARRHLERREFVAAILSALEAQRVSGRGSVRPVPVDHGSVRNRPDAGTRGRSA